MGAEMLGELVSTAASTLVAAMATDAWGAAKTGITDLFRRKGSPGDLAVVEVQLDRHAHQVAAASDADAIRRRLAPSWEVEIEALLAQDPDAVRALTALIAEVQGMLPQQQRAWVQTNIARDHGTVFAVQSGNIVIHQDPPPGGTGDGD
jgi:hypothetical protein